MLRSGDSAPPGRAAEAPAPAAWRRRTEAGSGSGSGGRDDDRISDLPDAVIGEIITRLPTKDGARTQVLGSRWRYLWRSAPLNLALRSGAIGRRGAETSAVVSRVLSTHPGPARRFCVPDDCGEDRLAAVDAWLLSPALDGLEELDLFYGLNSAPLPPPPASFFRFVPNLRSATVGHCHLTDGAVQGLHFPHLKHLGLEDINISETSMNAMIAACPALECLLIKCCFGFRRLRISSITIRSIGVGAGAPDHTSELQLTELTIENAPSLQMLLCLDRPHVLHVSVLSAPKLETLGCLAEGFRHYQNDFRFVFGSMVIQDLQVEKLTTVLRSVKILGIEMHTLTVDIVIDLIRCFPCLEKMYVQLNSRRGKNLWRSKHRSAIEHLDIRLKTLVLENYQGTKSDVNFATFFVLNARALELIMFQLLTGDYEFIVEQERKLQLSKRASMGAKFHFTTHSCLRAVSQLKHVSDLDVNDPFIIRC